MTMIADTPQNRTAPPPSLTAFRGWLAQLGDPKRAIINPLADAVFFYGAPLWGLALVIGLTAFPGLWEPQNWLGGQYGMVTFAVGAITTAHLLAVIFRSHMNQDVFRQWPLRFTLVPAVVFALFLISPWAMVIGSVLAIFWDVYHSGMQNFGLARIFDMRAGNPADKGRLLDSMISQVLYIGPIAAGASLWSHLDGFKDFSTLTGDGALGSLAQALTTIPAAVGTQISLVHIIAFTVSAICWGVYTYGYWRLAQQGYKVSPQKIMLMGATALTSLIAWTFSPPVVAFVVMNLFHAVQYFAMVWSREHKTVAKVFRLPDAKQTKWIALGLVCAVSMIFGLWDVLAVPKWTSAYAVILTVALMHFWYDGFIWSVRKKQV